MILPLIIGSSFGLAALPAVMHLMNWCVYRKPDPAGLQGAGMVSILIPARNEEANIEKALRAALATKGVPFEILVIDDQSTDRTAEIVERLRREDARVRLLAGHGLPAGWCGKQYACWRLAQAAGGEYLLFVDADVRLSPECAVLLRDHLAQTNTSLVSGVPSQLTETFLERLLIPLIHYLLLGFLPIFRMRQTSKPGYAAGCGQLFMAQAPAYRAMGGHETIRRSLHDGLSLPRAFRRAGFRTDLVDVTHLARCRMFENAAQVLRGLSRNAIEGLAAPKMIGPASLVLLGGQVVPWILLLLLPWIGDAQVLPISLAVGLTLVPRFINAVRYRQSWLGAVLHPFGILVLVGLQWYALFRYICSKPSSWRGRSYAVDDTSAILPANHLKTP